MLYVLIFLTCIAAFSCGWLLGPAVESSAFRLKEWGKKNEEKSYEYSKQYSIPGVWFTHPDIWDHIGEILAAIAAIIIFLVVWIWW